MQLLVNPIWPWPVVVAVAVGLLLFSHWTYSRGTPRRRLLLALRWIGVALAIIPLFRPTLVFQKKQRQSSVLVLLADRSKSMLLRDMWDDQSRWEAIKRVLGDSRGALDELAKEVQVRELSFSRRLGDSFSLDKPPDGDQTAMGVALEELLQRTAGERLAGVVLLSDGANTTGTAPTSVARRMAGLKAPIHAFGFGRETASDKTRDIAARSISASPTVFAKNKMSVRGEFSTTGFAGQQIGVRLLLNGVERARGEIKASEGSDRAIVDLTAVPEAAGDVKVTLQAESRPGELLPINNEISTFVTVLAGGISVVEIEGKYRYWEPKFLRWALDQSPDIELSQLFLLDSVGREEKAPADLFTGGKFDVYILGDVASNRFTPDQIRALAQRVQQGAGLLMIGGYESFGPGGWGETPLAEVLPVVVRPGDPQVNTPLKLVPTDAGLRHFVMRLGLTREANVASWSALRPLDGGSSWAGVKPGALLLAATPENAPLLAAQDVGAGRVIAFAGDTTWRWRKEARGQVDHARFWRQVILWLAHKEDQAGANLRVRLPQRRLAVGQRLPVEVGVEDGAGAPVPDAEAQAIVVGPDGRELPLDLIKQGGEFRGDFFQTDVEGDYQLRVVATAGGKALGSKTVKFLVYAEDSEMRQLAADLGAMRSLAQLSGGEYHDPEDLPRFLASLKRKDLNQEVSLPIYESLWDQWPLFVLFLGVICLEWIVRKRRGLA